MVRFRCAHQVQQMVVTRDVSYRTVVCLPSLAILAGVPLLHRICLGSSEHAKATKGKSILVASTSQWPS